MENNKILAAHSLQWFERHRLERSGVVISNIDRTAYNEVSGYWIPTLLAYGREETAVDMGRWLCSVQLANGSFRDCYGKANPFDAGQIIRGLHALALKFESFREPLHRVCGWLVSQIQSNGVPPNPSGPDIPEWILLYAYQPVVEAATSLGDKILADKARACVLAYAKAPLAPQKWESITHFYGYWLEGLVDAQMGEIAASHLERLAGRQKPDGSLSAFPHEKWICTPGLAQMGLAWHKLGMLEPARRALQWLRANQNSTGGWYGSYGVGAKYFPGIEISWAPKYVLDLIQAVEPTSVVEHLVSRSDTSGDQLLEDPLFISKRVLQGKRKPWADLLLRWTKTGQQILEIESGNAELSAHLGFHDRRMTLVDRSPGNVEASRKLFSALSLEVQARVADYDTRLPFADEEFDVVFSCGLLEHHVDAAMIRLLREFGRVARCSVISLVPSANSLPYRIGKALLEKNSQWKYGPERPLNSLRWYCEKAGLHVVEETTVGWKHSLNFLMEAGLESLADELQNRMPEDECGNGYLLATLAVKEGVPGGPGLSRLSLAAADSTPVLSKIPNSKLNRKQIKPQTNTD